MDKKQRNKKTMLCLCEYVNIVRDIHIYVTNWFECQHNSTQIKYKNALQLQINNILTCILSTGHFTGTKLTTNHTKSHQMILLYRIIKQKIV